MNHLKSLSRSTVEIMKEVGNYIRTERTRFNQNSVENKSARDLVSYVDKTAEKMLVEKLSKLLPEAGFVTEEKTTDKTGVINWIVDPLDGTTNYITGMPLYSSTVALAHDNEILLGVTYDIPANKCYFAWKDGGAFCENEKIRVKDNSNLDKALVIVGTPYTMDNITLEYFDLIKYIYENSMGIRITGSAAIDMVYVAAGYTDAFFEFNIKPWDVAAGYLLVKEAGGYVSTFDGAIDYNHHEVMASGNLQPLLIDLAQKFLKK